MKISVALIEPLPFLREAIKITLETSGKFFVHSTSANTEEVTTAILKKGAQPKVCILSTDIFTLSDLYAVQKLQKQFAEMKSFVLLSEIHELTMPMLSEAGVSGFILKEAAARQVLKALEATATKGVYKPRLSKQLLLRLKKHNFSTRLIKEHHLEFLKLCKNDLTYEEIGKRMGRKRRTVEDYRDYLFEKFKVNNRTSLVMFALQNGLIDF